MQKFGTERCRLIGKGATFFEKGVFKIKIICYNIKVNLFLIDKSAQKLRILFRAYAKGRG